MSEDRNGRETQMAAPLEQMTENDGGWPQVLDATEKRVEQSQE